MGGVAGGVDLSNQINQIKSIKSNQLIQSNQSNHSFSICHVIMDARYNLLSGQNCQQFKKKKKFFYL